MTAMDLVTTQPEETFRKASQIEVEQCISLALVTSKREDVTKQDHSINIPQDGNWYINDETGVAIRVCHVTSTTVGLHSVQLNGIN